jgi:hypothetical protein
MEATRFHDNIFRIYKNGVVLVEFYDIEKGKQYLKQLKNESNNITSTNRGGSDEKR